MNIDICTLYRPVGLNEALLILEANSKAFPPRRPEQPIFYPVLNFEYAEQIARDWNTKSPESGFAGFVTEFKIDKTYVGQFEEHVVGASIHRELWIPAERLEEFNQHVQGQIEIIAAYYGEGYKGPKHFFADTYADEMFAMLYALSLVITMEFWGEVGTNHHAILLNFTYWATHDLSHLALSEEAVRFIIDNWQFKTSPELHFDWSPHDLSQIILREGEQKRFLRFLARYYRKRIPEHPLVGSELVE